MDKLSAMAIFVSIVKEGSLTAAASQNGKSLPSVVRTLANLERFLGIKLVNRTTRKIALTNEGENYFSECVEILRSIDSVENSLREKNENVSISLNVSAPVKYGKMHISPLIKPYLELEKTAKINLILDNSIIDQIDQKLDFSIRVGVLNDSSLIAKKIGDIRSVLVASSGMKEKLSSLTSLDELETTPCVTFVSGGDKSIWSFRTKQGIRKIFVNSVFSSNDVDALISVCEAGMGIGKFFSYQVLPQLRDGSLVELMPNLHNEILPVSIVYPDAKLLPYRTRHAIDWFFDRLSSNEYIV